ncbi:hypothetical protein [uncultured Gemella sp.]|uniref:hypothetical protein n=1 Tax=uncultured Gemella sp. TaxID=254352 RepID=UPI0028D28959|nr:hypothetical protein [uncultured Gemella sp.]
MKKFNNIDSQIELLKSRNLRILNEEKAKENLKLYGYYEIVNWSQKYFKKLFIKISRR